MIWFFKAGDGWHWGDPCVEVRDKMRAAWKVRPRLERDCYGRFVQ
jgi:hypothetical protein